MTARKDPASTTVVLVADPHFLCAQGLGAALGQYEGFDVLKIHPTTGLDACEAAERHRADIVLLDYWMPDMDGPTATRTILSSVPGCRVILMCGFYSPQDIERAFEAGAAGFLPKSVGIEDVARAVRDAHSREGRDPKTFQEKFSALAGSSDQAGEANRRLWAAMRRLTPREVEILSLLNVGMLKDEIAENLVISAATVQTHIRNILRKMGNRPQAEVLYHARRFGILST